MTQMTFLENGIPVQPAAWRAYQSSGLERLKAFVPRAGRTQTEVVFKLKKKMPQLIQDLKIVSF